MYRRNLPMLVAVCGSLVVHGLFFRETTRVTLNTAGWLPDVRREERVAVVVIDPADASKDAADTSRPDRTPDGSNRQASDEPTAPDQAPPQPEKPEDKPANKDLKPEP